MASVIRIKRRLGEDPAEALYLSCKRLRRSEEQQSESKLESVLSFVGTISSKSEPVSIHIREAIKQKKIHKELHADVKHASPQTNFASRVRSQTAQASRNSRYKVLSGKRALDLAELDNDLEAESSKIDGQDHSTSESRADQDSAAQEKTSDNKENAVPTLAGNSSAPAGSVGAKSDTSCGESKKEFCIFDVEQDVEKPDPFLPVSQSASEITVNNVPMVCRKAEPEPTDDDQFVYDLYYTHSNLSDLDLAAALTVEALADTALLSEAREGDECEFVHDDSDDSNDEGNWRNDYPDEDPHFFENADYDYTEDMVDTGYLNDDESDLLAYWMDSRCNVESRSDDDEDEYGSELSDDQEDK